MENLHIARSVYPDNQPKEKDWMDEFNIGRRIPRKVNYESNISLEKWYEMIQKKFLTAESQNS